MIQCWKCHQSLELAENKVLFHSYCPHCQVDLHVCKNCKFYSVGKPNDCLIFETDFIRDREKRNFCEEFSVFMHQTQTPKSELKKPLFTPDDIPKKIDFNDLFKDNK